VLGDAASMRGEFGGAAPPWHAELVHCHWVIFDRTSRAKLTAQFTELGFAGGVEGSEGGDGGELGGEGSNEDEDEEDEEVESLVSPEDRAFVAPGPRPSSRTLPPHAVRMNSR